MLKLSPPISWRMILAVSFGIEFIISNVKPLVSQYAASLGAGTLEVGLIASAYAFFPLLLAVHAGRIIDRTGSRLPALIGVCGTSMGLALPFIFPALWSLYASQVIVGTSHLFALVALQGAVGAGTTSATRDQRFSLFALAVSAGSFLGPVLGGHIAELSSFRAAFLMAGLMGVLVAVAACFLPNSSTPTGSSGPARDSSVLALLKIPPLRMAIATGALVLYSRDIFVVYFPLYAMHTGLTSSTIGWLVGVQALSVVAVRVFLGKLTLAVGRERVLGASILLAGICYLVIPVTVEVLLLAAISALVGLGLGCGQPLSMSTAYTVAPKFRRSEALGLRLAANRLSQFVAPLFFGATGAWLGLLSVFYLSGAFLIGGALIVQRRKSETR